MNIPIPTTSSDSIPSKCEDNAILQSKLLSVCEQNAILQTKILLAMAELLGVTPEQILGQG